MQIPLNLARTVIDKSTNQIDKPSPIRLSAIGLLLLSVFFSAAVFSAKKDDPQGPGGMDFVKEKERGWFWYEKMQEEIEESKIEPEPPPPPPPEEQPQPEKEIAKAAPPPTSSPAPAGPAPLSAEWFRKNLDTYRDRAIDTPSGENVQAYLYLQRIMMDKAERFARKYEEMVVGDPYLDETSRYPTASFAGKNMESVAKNEGLALLTKISERAGIFFFFKGDCPLCGQQAWILNEFRKKNGIEVIAVSIDGSRLSKEYFKTIDDSGQAAMMGVGLYPAIVLASPPKKYKPIGQGGGYTVKDIEERTLLVAKSLSVISEEEYERTYPVKGSFTLTDTSDLEMDDQLLQDPQRMINIIRALTPIN